MTTLSHMDPWPVQALEATLGLSDGPENRTDLPPLWHWLYFLPTAPRFAIGRDGHMINQEWADASLRRRRLFAAARTEFLRPLRIGVPAKMTERVIGQADKVGKHGPFHIQTAEYMYFQDEQLCVREERDIVYLQGPAPFEPAPKDPFPKSAPNDPWALSLTPDPVMLMRYSALTFNSHLIHFDQLYTQREEGYRERVVHGPLVAIILAKLVALNGIERLKRFDFRARSPLFVNQAIQFEGKAADDRIELRAIGASGVLAMQATAWTAAPA